MCKFDKIVFMGELIAEMMLLFSKLALNIQEFFFRKKKRKRRALERKEGLPKKRMISPYQRFTILIVFLVIFFIVVKLFGVFSFDNGKKKTIEKITAIQELLDEEKKVFEIYPKKLKVIIRNNPLRKGLLQDGWGNDFKYEPLNDGKSFLLFSVGKDGVTNTEDDIE